MLCRAAPVAKVAGRAIGRARFIDYGNKLTYNLSGLLPVK
jgi:hypothetical protein